MAGYLGMPARQDRTWCRSASTWTGTTPAPRGARRAVHARLLRAHRAREGPAPAGRGLPRAAPRDGAAAVAACDAAGYLAPEHRAYLARHRRRAARTRASRASSATAATLDRAAEDRVPARASTCCRVPSPYAEPKGLYLLEAMANGVPGGAAAARRLSRDAASAPAAACCSSRTTRDDLARAAPGPGARPRAARRAGPPRRGRRARALLGVARMAERALEVYAARRRGATAVPR